MSEFPRAGFRRRFAAWIYDSLMVVAIYMFLGLILSSLFHLMISFGYVDIVGFSSASDYTANSIAFKLLLNVSGLGAVVYFFIYFCSKGGQTLGMKAWRLRVQYNDGRLISKKTALLRLLLALLGLGNVAVLIDRKNKLSLQDRATNTEVVVLSSTANMGV